MTSPLDHHATPPDDARLADAESGAPAHSPPAIAAGCEVRVQRQPIDVESEITPIMRNTKVGAVVNFLGIVRNCGDVDDVTALEIEHYPGMTEQSLWSIVEEATARWQVDAVKIVHRVGRITLGHPVVLVVVASSHRGAAFDACEFLMDFLKTHAPFWKKEIRRDGASEWVEAKTRDEQAMTRWG